MARFRASARTVDMLGRQQIAGIPTAISELFKNAHDAYATAAEADYIRYRELFVLRDDGIGMTRDEFERRWLTLGTAVKASRSGQADPPPGMGRRAVLGEKGIGRLAIAAIGPQALVLTRHGEGKGRSPLTVALVHWAAFELPDVELDLIDIPVDEVATGGAPDLPKMAEQIRINLRDVASDADHPVLDRIERDLEVWEKVDPVELAGVLGVDALVGTSGTCFVIAPTSPDLSADLEETEPKEAPPLLKTLIGFANTMTPGHPEPELRTAFRDHRAPDNVSDLIAESEFFSPDEFSRADHHFEGRFDEYGQFSGTVTVFGGQSVSYPLAWSGARGSPTKCGPFSLDLAYIQGLQRQSNLPPAEWHRMVSKLDRYGGLYIYRDGIRVLPYGDNRFDWLDVELRRNKSASDYFFSYRRMFGAVEITREQNSALREKAGREGFSTNEAYRQFRSILRQFLVQVAMEFFREGGARTEAFDEGRLANERLDKARAARSRHVRVRRQQLRDELEAFFAAVETDEPARRAAEIVDVLRVDVDRAVESRDTARAVGLLASAEATARDAIRDLDNSLDIRRPRGVGLSRDLQRDVEAYERERARLYEEIVLPCLAEVETTVSRAGDERQAAVQRRVRFDQALESVSAHSRGDVQNSRRELNAATEETRAQARELATESLTSVENEVQQVLARAARLDVAVMADDEFVAQRAALEERIAQMAGERARAMLSVAEQLRAVAWPVNGDGPLVTAADQVEELETRLEAFIERSEQDVELTQLGLAVEIINHEFQTSIRSIRENMRRLRGWADSNKELRGLYRDLSSAFDHLDGYLRLFTPLHRRLYREAVEIRGRDLERFVRDVFRERLEQEDITLEATSGFRDYSVRLYPSTLYPVFVNLVDNAVHWLTGYRGRRQITLDVEDGDLTVVDTGPGISERDRDAVFEMGFSRKPGGTGYGLYISREVLRREKMDLLLDRANPDRGTQFRIVAKGGEPSST